MAIKAAAFAVEARSSGSVPFSAYLKYFTSGGGYVSFIFLILNCIAAQVLFSATDYWLNLWTNAEQMKVSSVSSSSNSSSKSLFASHLTVPISVQSSSSRSWQEQIDTTTGIHVYSILISGVFVFSLARTTHLFINFLFSSMKLHNQMFRSVIRSPLAFFDRNPVGKDRDLSLFCICFLIFFSISKKVEF